MKPFLSIITVAFKNPDDVFKTLNSTYGVDEEIENIVIDGSENKKIKSITNDFEARYFSGKDKGPFDAMNIGVHKANGEYIWILNSGDVCFCKFNLIKALSIIKSSKKKDIFYFDTIMDKNIIRQSKFSKIFFRFSLPPHPSIIYPQKISDNHNYLINYHYSADLIFKINLFLNFKNINYIPIILSRFAKGGRSTTKSFKDAYLKRIDRIKIDFKYCPKIFFPISLLFNICAFLIRR